jgi:hypothetical protein
MLRNIFVIYRHLRVLPAALWALAISTTGSTANTDNQWHMFKARPYGIIEKVAGDSPSIACAGALISQKHVLVPNCKIDPTAGEYRLLLGNDVLTSPFKLKSVAIEVGRSWRIYEVEGRPSQFFGLAPFDEKRETDWPKADSFIDVLTFQASDNGKTIRKVIRTKCYVRSIIKGSPRRFDYYCADGGPPITSYPEFVLNGDNGLIAIQEEPGKDVALEIADLRKTSKILSKTKPALSSMSAYWKYLGEMNSDFQCEKAGYYASHPEELLALGPGGYNQVSMRLRGCADQMLANKWKAPENRTATVIRTISHGDDQLEYEFHSMARNEGDKIINACWFGGGRQDLVIASTLRQDDPQVPLSCRDMDASFRSIQPVLMNPFRPVDDANLYREDRWTPSFGDPEKILNAWADSTPAATVDPIKESKKVVGVTVGPIYERCLISWDDSFNVHSVGWNGIRMKKLRHCVKLIAKGPVDAKQVAKEYIDHCVNKALNDDKVRHLLQLVLGVAADVLTAGASGGGGTAAAITDYIVEVQQRALSCLTDEKKIQQFVAEALRDAFGAEVKRESHWIYWNV